MKVKFLEVFQGNQKIEEVTTDSGEKKYVISGAFTMVGRPNGNNRIYTKEDMDHAIEKCKTKVAQKRIRMGLDHPSMTDWGIPKLKECAAILLDLTPVQEDGYAYYKAQIIDTQVGKDLKAIVDAGSPVGVSTRGYGDSMEDQEYPGLDGKFTIIKNFELKSIDFVDDPSVSDTELMMQLESNKRSDTMEIKSLEELKKAFPEFVGQLETSAVADVKKALEEKIVTISKTADESLTKLVESVKAIKPEMFTTVTVTETELVKEYKAKVVTLESEVKKFADANDTLTKKIEALESNEIKLNKEREIKTLEASDAAYFGYPTLVKKFEACNTAEEVRKVYESNKELLAELQKTTTPAPSKTQTPDPAKGALTDAQKSDLNFMNQQRMSAGLNKMTEADYLAKIK
jgi:hypothetical protein